MPDHATKWFAFFAVKEGIVTPHMCREIHEVLGDDIELLLFAEVIIANNFATTEEVQALIDRAWNKAKNTLPPPKDVFASAAPGVWGVPQDSMPRTPRRKKTQSSKKQAHDDTVEFVLEEQPLPAESADSIRSSVVVPPAETGPSGTVLMKNTPRPLQPSAEADIPNNLQETLPPPENLEETVAATETFVDTVVVEDMEGEAIVGPSGNVPSTQQTILKPIQPQLDNDAVDEELEELFDQVDADDDKPEIREVASKTKEVLRSKIMAALKRSKETDSPPKLAASELVDPDQGKLESEEPLTVDTSALDLDDVSVDFDHLAELDRDALKVEMLKLLKRAHDANASDLHLSSNSPPFIRGVDGISFLDDHVLTAAESRLLNTVLLSPTQETFFLRKRDYDNALTLDETNRFRVNLMMHNDGVAGVYRLLPSTIRSLDELGFRNADVIRTMLDCECGLILVGGPANSGKTSTLAAMISELNDRRNDHIVAIEDPVEIVHKSANCSITQREVGINTSSFHAALRSAMRQDAGVIVVGDLVDVETVELAVAAADTGRLVIGAVPTLDVASALNRLLHAYPEPQQTHVRARVADSLRGVISQRLIPDKDEGRTVACEVLLNNLAVANLIRRGKTHGLRPIMEAGTHQGMCTMDQYVLRLFEEDVISKQTANEYIVDRSVRNRIRSHQKFGDVAAHSIQGMSPGGSSKNRWGVMADD